MDSSIWDDFSSIVGTQKEISNNRFSTESSLVFEFSQFSSALTVVF